jgi:catechol 2,3-dioxygenase-like lactoylglutathione lyase family enzyme
MKRLHVSLAVKDLQQSVQFYSTLFAAGPTVLKPDYAKWMLEDPWVNFSISTRGEDYGLDHLGIQVESRDGLSEIADRLERAGRGVYDKGEAHCCYAHSHKAWVRDPEGLAWESFFTFGTDTVYGESDRATTDAQQNSVCCSDTACGASIPASVEDKQDAQGCCAA